MGHFENFMTGIHRGFERLKSCIDWGTVTSQVNKQKEAFWSFNKDKDFD